MHESCVLCSLKSPVLRRQASLVAPLFGREACIWLGHGSAGWNWYRLLCTQATSFSNTFYVPLSVGAGWAMASGSRACGAVAARGATCSRDWNTQGQKQHATQIGLLL